VDFNKFVKVKEDLKRLKKKKDEQLELYKKDLEN
jgi:hypothetical protein